MNDTNKQAQKVLDHTVWAGVEQLELNGEKIDLSKINIYPTNDPMLGDKTVTMINKLGILARVKQVDDSLFVYAEPTWSTPLQRAILLKEANGFPPGTRVRIYDIKSRESALTNAYFNVETLEGNYKTFRVHREDLILDRNAKNLYFCKRQTIRNGVGFETVLTPISRYEYYDVPDKNTTADAWNMFNVAYPGFKDADIILTHEHPTPMQGNGAYQTIRKECLQEFINRNTGLHQKYQELTKSNQSLSFN